MLRGLRLLPDGDADADGNGGDGYTKDPFAALTTPPGRVRLSVPLLLEGLRTAGVPFAVVKAERLLSDFPASYNNTSDVDLLVPGARMAEAKRAVARFVTAAGGNATWFVGKRGVMRRFWHLLRPVSFDLSA